MIFSSITDFNELKETGYLFIEKALLMDNRPNTSSSYGYLGVIFIKNGYIRQTYIDIWGIFFIRVCNNGTWTDWKQIQTT